MPSRRCGSRLLWAGLIVAIWAVAVVPARAAAGTPLPSNATLLVEGHGWGHGRGMGQWGAKGQADAGRTWTQIVLSYYSGATVGTRPPDEDLRVLVETSSDVLVSSDAQFTVKWIGAGTFAGSDATYKFFRARHDGTAYIVEKAPAHTGPWTLVGTNTIPPRFMPGTAMIQHIENTGIVRYYRGFVDAIRTGTTSLRSINEVTMTGYLYGAVPREMPATWAPEAVRAQAVAARSYATYKRDAARAAGQNYDICATTSCQVYLGAAYRTSVTSTTVIVLEHSASTAAVGATAGKVLFSSGKAILAEYSSSTGGYTAAGSVSYLSPVPDPWDSISPHHDWSAEIAASSIEAEWPEIGELVGLNITQRTGYGEWGGRVVSMQVVGTTTTVTISGNDFRSAFAWPSNGDVKSNWFQIATYKGALAATPAKVATVTGTYGTLQILMKNTGTAAWTVGGAVRLATPDDSPFAGPGWISATRPSAVASNASVPGKSYIGVGEVGRFIVRLNAFVLSPGTYGEQLQLVNDDLGVAMSAWFTITVPVVRPMIGVVRGNIWYLHTGGASDTAVAFGSATDTPVVGDWDGDGKDTPGVRRGNDWYLDNGFDGTADIAVAFGSATDTPVVGDWNGDGVVTPGVRRGNDWYLDNGFDGTADIAVAFGSATDTPVVGDWDGDGKDTPGVRRGKDWYLDNGFDGTADIAVAFGGATDTPVVGDWDGDDVDTPGAVQGNAWSVTNGFDAVAEQTFAYGLAGDDPIVGYWGGPPLSTPGLVDGNTWLINTSFDGDAEVEVGYGLSADRPVAGDWNGDHRDTPGVIRGNEWFLNNGFDATGDVIFAYGSATDVMIVGDWDGDGIDTPGVVRGGMWHLNNDFDGVAEVSFAFGTGAEAPVVGDWDGDGVDTPGLVIEGAWHLNNGFDGSADIEFAFGSGSGNPVAGDWNGDGADTPGSVAGSTWSINDGFDPTPEKVFVFGDGSEDPITGSWT